MISISEALKIVEKRIGKLPAEKVDLNDSCRRVLAEDIFADTHLPPFDRSQMDGFAVRAGDVKNAVENKPVKLRIVGESAAGKGFDGKLKRGEAVRIMTGARLPAGADAVQKKELAREVDAGQSVEILEAAERGQNFVAEAAEIKKDKKLFTEGEIITPPMIASLAAFGCARVGVFRQPRVSVLATGSEIVPVGEKPARDQIRDSNSAMLEVFAGRTGAKVKVLPLVRDDTENLKSEIKRAAKKSDILTISGGVSVGDYDFTKPALDALGARIFFEKIALRPGKPTVFAKLGDCSVFGLPGNPVSAAVTFCLFVRKAILQLQGAKNCDLPEGFARLTKKAKGAKQRDSFVPARIFFSEDAQIFAEPVKWGGSSDFVAFSRADCLIYVPRDKVLEAEETARIVFLPK